MKNYESTDNYKEERKIRTIETWEKTIVKLTKEKQQEQMQYIANKGKPIRQHTSDDRIGFCLFASICLKSK